MGKYGNSGGANKGKKYIKLTGGEVATVVNEARARRFMNWYGVFYKELARCIRNYDYEVATDTMIAVYEAIALKGLVVNNYKFYFVRAYHTTLLKARKAKTLHLSRHVDINDDAEDIAAPDFDFEMYEVVIEQINGELMDFVRANNDPVSVSLFEMYIALQPDISYTKLGEMLGFSANRIYLTISVIKRNLKVKFKRRKDFLLSLA